MSAFFWSRLAILLVNWPSGRFLKAPIGAGFESSYHGFACGRDYGWYLSIATGGYSMDSPANQPDATNLSFFTAYPYLVRLFATMLSAEPRLTGMVISDVAFLAALFYLYRYCRAAGASE